MTTVFLVQNKVYVMFSYKKNWGTLLYDSYNDVPLDRVWSLASLPLIRVHVTV